MSFNRRKTEQDQYEDKLLQLEQNLKGFSALEQNKFEVSCEKDKKRSLSKDAFTLENVKRNKKVEPKIQNANDLQIKKQVDKFIEAYPWQSFLDSLLYGFQSKILQYEDKMNLLQNLISSKIDEMNKKVEENGRQIEKLTRQIQSRSSSIHNQEQDDLNIQSLFGMVKRSIDNQSILYKEFSFFKESIESRIASSRHLMETDLHLTEIKKSFETARRKEQPEQIQRDNLIKSKEKLEKYHEMEEQPFDRKERRSIHINNEVRQQSEWDEMYSEYLVSKSKRSNGRPIMQKSSQYFRSPY